MYVKNILIYTCKLASIATAIAIISACEAILPTPHKIDIEQGNTITQEEFESIYTGMTREDVTKALGQPMLQDPFHSDRWDYIYRLKPGKGRVRESRFTLYFRNGILVKIDGKDYKEY